MHYRKISALFLGLIAVLTTQGQTTTRSPYTLFGLGELQPISFFNQSSMGNIGRVVREDNQFSIANPASYSALKFAKFEYGSSAEFITQRTATEENQYGVGRFNYLSLGVPLSESKNRGFSFGLIPYSNVGYEMEYLSTEDTANVLYSFTGQGGLNQFYAGLGWELIDGLSVGANAKFTFGSIQQSKNKRYVLSKDIFSFLDIDNVHYSGFMFDLGVQYYGQTKSEIDYLIGATFQPKANITACSDRLVRTYNASGEFFIDSILSVTDEISELVIPAQMGFGFSIGKRGSWLVGAEYESSDWSNFKTVDNQTNFQQATRYSFGGYLQFADETDKQILKGERFTHFVKTIRYYYGVNYSQTYLNVNGESIDQLGISFGLGLPVMREKALPEGRIPVVSRITIGGEYVTRGTTSSDLIQEDFFRIKLGLSLSDKWFQQKKFR